MAEQFLQALQVNAVADRAAGKRVAKGVEISLYVVAGWHRGQRANTSNALVAGVGLLLCCPDQTGSLSGQVALDRELVAA